MLAINQNYFNLNFDYFIPSFRHSPLRRMKDYQKLFGEFYVLNRVLKNYFDNIDTFLLIHRLNRLDVKKIKIDTLSR